MIENKIPRYLFYLFCTFPILIATGPLLADILVVIFFFSFFFYFKDINNNKIIFDFVIILLFIFYFFAIISSFISKYEFYSLKSSLLNLRFFLFIFLSVYLIKLFKNKIYIFFNLLNITVVFICFDAIIQYLFGFNIFGFTKINPVRISGIFGDELVLGSFLSKIYPILITLHFYLNKIEKNLNKNYFFTAITLLITFVIIISGERAALYSHLLYIGLCFLFLIKVINYKKIILIAGIFLIFLSFIFYSNQNLKNRVLFPVKYLVDNKSIFLTYHENHFKLGFLIYKSNIFLGAGPKNFRHECKKFEDKTLTGCSTHPHNTYIQILAETGSVGFFLIMIVFLYFCYNYIKFVYLNYKSKNNSYLEYLAIISGLIIYLFPISTNGNFFNNWLNFFFALFLIFYLFLKPSKNIN
tara:strand:+ start:187 stop:1422 length:1236 start_codon:yes stop_codon:yes gene_type:complete